MLSSMRAKNINCEQEARFVQDRITSVERNIAEFCVAFGAYSRKAARLRDKGDEVSRVSLAYAESEDVNKTLSHGLANFANYMSLMSDYGDLRVQKIDRDVVNEFSQYEDICKRAKDEVKQIFSVRGKEIARKRQLDRARERNPRNRQQIIQAETELVKASSEMAKTIHNLEEQITSFERQKLHDVKTILLKFIGTEMGYHAKCLELLTQAYQDVNRTNEESDLQDFKKSLRMPDTIPHVGAKRSVFRASQSLGSLTSIFSTPKKKSPGIPMNKSAKKTSRSEEILDTAKDEDSESDISDSASEEIDNSEGSKKEDAISPFIARKYLK